MPVSKFADLHNPSQSTVAAVHTAAAQAIHAACVKREAEISYMDETVSKLTKSFRGSRKFTVAEVDRILNALNTFGRAVHAGRDNSLRHMSTAIACDLPTAKLVAQTEDYAALGAKIAILHQVANASVMAEEGADDLLQVSDNGYLQEPQGDIMDQLPPQAPPQPTTSGDDGMDGLLGPDMGAAPAAPAAAPAPAAPAAPLAPAAQIPVSASRRRRADTGYERYDVNAGENEKEPVGTPQDGGKSRTR